MNDTTNEETEDRKAKEELAALGILKGAAKDEGEQVARAVWPALVGVGATLLGIPVERPCLQTLILFQHLELELTSGVPAMQCANAVDDAVKVLTILRLPIREASLLVANDRERFAELCMETACELPAEAAEVVVAVIDFLNDSAKGQVRAELPDDLKSKDTPSKKARPPRGR